MGHAEFDPQARMSRRKFAGYGAALIGGAVLSGCGDQASADNEQFSQQIPPTETPIVNKHGETIDAPFDFDTYNSLNFPVAFNYPDTDAYNVLSTDDYYGKKADLILGPTYNLCPTTIDITHQFVPLTTTLEDVGESSKTEMRQQTYLNIDGVPEEPRVEPKTFVGEYPAMEIAGGVDFERTAMKDYAAWERRALFLRENSETGMNDLYQIRMREAANPVESYDLHHTVFERVKAGFVVH